MDDNNNPKEKERLQPVDTRESIAESLPETKEATERKESSPDELAQLKQHVESLVLPDDAKQQANVTAQSIQSLSAQKKVEQLVQLAKEKGIIYAVHVAKNMDDAYVLDALHDVLAKEGMYKQFLK